MTDVSRLVLFEDNHLLVLNKPAEIATMGVTEGEPSLHASACDYLKRKYNKPGNVFLGVVSRVDSFVTGVVVFARTSKAASRLSEQFRDGSTEKIYWAAVEQAPQPPAGECVDFVAKDDAAHRMRCVSPKTPHSQEARLRYRTLKRFSQGALLEIELLTGRKHQIRVQLSERGWPIIGDQKYEATTRFPKGIALHSRRLTITHPTLKTTMRFEAPVPPSWNSLE